MKLKKGDNVIMLNGKDRGKKGKITHVFHARRSLGEGGSDGNKIVVEGLNLIKKVREIYAILYKKYQWK